MIFVIFIRHFFILFQFFSSFLPFLHYGSGSKDTGGATSEGFDHVILVLHYAKYFN